MRTLQIINIIPSTTVGVPSEIQVQSNVISSFHGQGWIDSNNNVLPFYAYTNATLAAADGYKVLPATTFEIIQNAKYAGKYTVHTKQSIGAAVESTYNSGTNLTTIKLLSTVLPGTGAELTTGSIINISTYRLGIIGENAGIDVLEESTVSNRPIELIGRFKSGWGEVLQQNMLRVVQSFAGPSAPLLPFVGQLWFDTTSNVLKVYTNSPAPLWQETGSGSGSNVTTFEGTIPAGVPSAVVVGTFDIALNTSKFQVTIKEPNTNSVHTAEISSTVQSGVVYTTQYGVITSGSELGTFSTDIDGSNVRLIFTKNTTNEMLYSTVPLQTLGVSTSTVSGVSSFNARTGAVSLTPADISTALGYAPYAATNPNNFISTNKNIVISGDATGSGSTAINLTLSNTGVIPGSYTNTAITVSADGRITSASTGSINITPGGDPTQIQFNNSGALSGDSRLTWDDASGTFSAFNVSANSLFGNGSGLTHLNAAEITTGVVQSERLGTGTPDSTKVLLGNGTWSKHQVPSSTGNGYYQFYNIGTQTFDSSSALQINKLVGSIGIGGAAGSTNILTVQGNTDFYGVEKIGPSEINFFNNALKIGTVTSDNLSNLNISAIQSASIIFSISGITRLTIDNTGNLISSGIFQGNGSGLTNLQASAITGIIPPARLGTGVLDSTAVLRGNGTWGPAPVMTDGSGLTNLQASAITGIIPPARLGTGAANSGTILYGDGTWGAAPSSSGSSPGGTSGAVQYKSGSNFAGSNSLWINTDKTILGENNTSVQVGQTEALLQINSVGTPSISLLSTSQNLATPMISLGKSFGTSTGDMNAVPTGVTLGEMQFIGTDGSAAATPSAYIRAASAELFSTSGYGTILDIGTTAVGEIVSQSRIFINEHGFIGINNTNPTSAFHVLNPDGSPISISVGTINVGSSSIKAVNAYAGTNLTYGTNSLSNIDTSNSSNGEGNANIAIGDLSTRFLITGSHNVCLGYRTLGTSTNGSANTCIGSFVLRAGTAVNSNVGIGTQALYNLDTGDYNVAVGPSALNSTISTSNTTAIGHSAGSAEDYTGTNNTFIGFDSNAPSNVSDTITLGNSAITTLRCNATSITSLSDERDKSNIVELSHGLDFLMELNPVEFTWNTRDKSKVGTKASGFIAQDLLRTEKKFDSSDVTNLVSCIDPNKLEATYGNLIPVLVKAIQDLKNEFDEYRKMHP